nr:unnamed protein product [Lysinibacillus sphaericus]
MTRQHRTFTLECKL